MHSSPKIVMALSGFLGRTEDWSLIPDLVPTGWQLETVDLWAESELANYDEWAKRTSEQIATKFPNQTKVLLGYSMGGRLALHALIRSPNVFDGAVIVSANPGLISEAEKALRKKADEIWAAKFLHDSWAALMTEWDSQSTLRSPADLAVEAVSLERREVDFSRRTLAQALRKWSLGEQRDLRGEISALTMPIEFVTGKADEKFSTLARELTTLPAKASRSHVVISQAGHRVPWDAPSQFRAVLANFLARW